MPSPDTTFGGLPLPVPAGAASDSFPDPACDALLDYLGFWLREMLNAKLASMGGARPARPGQPSEDPANACPVANVYAFDPMLGEVWRRNPKPAIYIWWNGQSKSTQKTIVYKLRERQLALLWVFVEVNSPEGDGKRYGTLAGVDAVIERAIDRGSHPSYGYDGATPGTPIWRSMGVDEIKIVDMVPGKLAPIPAGGERRDAAVGQVINYYPAVRGTIVVSERVPADSLGADDLNVDMSMIVATNEEGDVLDPLDVVEIIIPGPPVGP